MPRSRGKQLVVGAAVAAVAGILSACSPADALLGLQPNTAVLSNSPAITAGQATTVAGRALAQAQRADALRTQEAATSAYTGLALTIAPSRYVVENVLDPGKNTSGGALLPTAEPTRIIITAGRDFPRTVLALWQPQGDATQQLAVMDSADVRTPFRVSTRVDLLPGQTLPPTPPNGRGASVLPPDVQGLVATPQHAVQDLASLLQTGSSGSTPFQSSMVVSEVRSKAAAQAKDVAKVAVFQQTHTARTDGLRAFRTADGGAVVVGAINRRDLFTVRKGAGVITPPPAYQALTAGKLKQITRFASVTTVEIVVLVVPPEGKGQARVIGFTEVPVAVSGA